MQIKVDAEKVLAMLRKRAVDLPAKRRKVMVTMGWHQVRSTMQNFLAMGKKDDSSGVWAPLATSTIAGRKKGQRKNPMPLVRTGILRNSILPKFEEGAEASVLRVGTNVPYSKWHQQDGDMEPPSAYARLPKRVFLRFHKADIEFFEKMCLKEFGAGGGSR